MTTDNSELLRRYVADRSESAFASLVERHIDLVYSSALRQVSGDVPAAQDVTQAVFCDLARQARRLIRHPSLTGWLFTSTRYLAAKARRAEQRRRTREQQACVMNHLLESTSPDPSWQELRPALDDAMHDLNATDRDAVLMRYFEEPVLGGIKAPAFVFKFEADGYAPLVTRTVLADEIEARFSVHLRAASATTVTVLLPDGTPAAHADIGLVSSGTRLQVIPGGLSRQNVQSGGSLLTADGQGQFRFPPDTTILRLIAAHPGGIAEITPGVLAVEPVLRLQEWGRLEGTFLLNGEPAAGHELLLEYGQSDRRVISANFAASCLTSGQEGKFAFAQVPPGQHRLMRRVETTGFPAGHDGKVWRHQPLCDVEIRPGETTTMRVDGSGDFSDSGKALSSQGQPLN